MNILSKLQLSSSNGLGVMTFEDLEEKDDSLNQLISGGGVCRKAPATPGLYKVGEGGDRFGILDTRIPNIWNFARKIDKLWSCPVYNIFKYNI